ncbi:bifunctional folylpolyglutamate synthase/dihydrofolate synthase [Solibacillus sp. A46]|uniref:tetrahydrofolate synthase n=1 Tax=Solibacillus faecavium TaxID=2762221 RepID=A0ABR8XZF1_9BACL|nr:folylpolyglutamate synthase/dihydrofolate synthase family protein [Solibacillus faecavium]MBD8037310.1 bifunctional folylpolyglutamate synthase/dihydrofolate synthase [Solibacillus faecavium]
MFQSIEQCTNFIFQLKASQYKGEPLQSAKMILNALGNPEKKNKFIHFAGSNGKGSTLNATREILMAHGLTVGAFISPHLERANERVTINKNQISDEDFLNIANQLSEVIKEKLDGKFPSFFEFMTLLALQYFAEQQVDVVLLETGIGGRLDSTNVVLPEVSVITTISLEHTDMLGESYGEIAAEKAGIIKTMKPVVVGVKNKEALSVIKEAAIQLHAPIYLINEQFYIENNKKSNFNYVSDINISNITMAMVGEHQKENAALAITAVKLFLPSVDEKKVKQALQDAKWDGRFERVTGNIILDGAHNSEGTMALVETIKEVAPQHKVKFIYAALQDKDHALSIELMDKFAAEMHFTQINLPRAATANQLFEQSNHAKKFMNPNWQQLIETEKANLAEDELLVITGSLYFIAEVRSLFVKKGWIS